MSDAGSHRSTRVLLQASLIATTGALPVFLFAAVAVLARAEIGFSEDQLGAGVAVFFGSASATAVWAGRFVHKLGSSRGLRLGALGSSASLAGLATVQTWRHIIFWLALAGVAHTICQVASNLRLANHVTRAWLGTAFGVKQSALPAATLLAGSTLPVIAVAFGWRAVFVAASGIALCGAFVGTKVIEPTVVRERRYSRDLNIRALVILAVAAAFASAAPTAMGSFAVEYAVHVGLEPAVGGIILTIGSAIGIAVRIVLGNWADRRPFDQLWLISRMLAGGAVILLAFILASSGFGVLIAISLGFAVAWGWPGLFQFAIVTKHESAPAVASGITLVGVFSGAMIGPFAFGHLVVRMGYPTAWLCASIALLIGAGLMALGRRELISVDR